MTASKTIAVDSAIARGTTARLRRARHWHVGLMLLVPAAGCGLAAYEVALGHFQTWHVALLAVGYLVTMMSITVGFHRLFAHRAFKTSTALRCALAVAGSMAMQGPPLYWVCNHRLHHQRTDRAGDPHSPHVRGDQALGGLRGLWHAHAGWSFNHALANPVALARDLLRDRWLLWVNQRYAVWVALGLVIPALWGGAYTGTLHGAWEGLLWGGLVRLFLNFHVTCSINSITHVFGKRAFQTKDQSRNNVWLAIPTLGEAWHNNHHAFPNSAWLGLERWQIDFGGMFIHTLAVLGLVQDVVKPSAQSISAARTGRGKCP